MNFADLFIDFCSSLLPPGPAPVFVKELSDHKSKIGEVLALDCQGEFVNLILTVMSGLPLFKGNHRLHQGSFVMKMHSRAWIITHEFFKLILNI